MNAHERGASIAHADWIEFRDYATADSACRAAVETNFLPSGNTADEKRMRAGFRREWRRLKETAK